MSGPLSPENVNEVTRVLDLSGVFASAIVGGVLARAKRLDLFGFLVIGIVAGLGGGVLRDTLLQHGTPVALTDYSYLAVAAAGTLLAFLADLSHHTSGWTFNLLDAMALSVWAIAGAQKTLSVGLGWLPAVLLGTITAVGGGAVRDLLLARTPTVFGRTPLYATVAMAVSGAMVLCSRLGAPSIGIPAGIFIGVSLRLTAVAKGWRLPTSRDWRPEAIRDRGLRAQPSLTQDERHPGMTRNDSFDTVVAGLDEIRSDLQDFYKDLHAHPELGHREHRTATRVTEGLRGYGYQVHVGIGGTGVVGVLSNGGGPTVLLRADMDALPVREETGLA